jgi:hypothetical protein
VSDFLLNRTRKVLGLSISCEARIIGELAGYFLDLTLNLVQRAFKSVVCARFHLFVSSLYSDQVCTGRSNPMRPVISGPPKKSKSIHLDQHLTESGYPITFGQRRLKFAGLNRLDSGHGLGGEIAISSGSGR